MNPELATILQKRMHLTDEELAAVMQDPEQLEALLDVVFAPN